MLAALGLAERALFPELLAPLWTIRYGFLVPVALGGLLLFGHSGIATTFTRAHFQRVVTAIAVLVFVGLGAMGVVLVQSLSSLTMYYAGMGYMLSLLGLYVVIRIRFITGAAIGLISVAIATVFMFTLHEGPIAAEVSVTGMAMLGNAVGLAGLYFFERAARRNFDAQLRIDVERARGEILLKRILPEPIAKRLMEERATIADGFSNVAVLFADIADFTPLAARLPADRLVRRLDAIFGSFDRICEKWGAEKIKTIGDAYMAAVGIPTPSAAHAETAVAMALDMLAAVEEMRPIDGRPVRL